MICFLDVDGVLANFNKGAFLALGLEYRPDHPALRRWDWYTYFGISIEGLNAVCDWAFWAGLEWTPDGHEIMELVESTFGRKNVYLLTTPMPNVGSESGKSIWVRRHLPDYLDRLIVSRAPKHIFAGPDRVLIDDNTDNIVHFREGGGQAVPVARPWNIWREDRTIEILKLGLEIIKDGESKDAD
jgi:5'(3')-deoxyribonucleotidase